MDRRRVWEQKPSKTRCERCDRPLLNRQVSHGITKHAACYREARVAGREQRRAVIAGMWLTGASLKDIGRELGASAKTISVDLVRMRRAGWDVPPRGPGGRDGSAS